MKGEVKCVSLQCKLQTFRENLITERTTPQENSSTASTFKLHTTWECQILSRIAKDLAHQDANFSLDSTTEEDVTQGDNKKDKVEGRSAAQSRGGMYNLVFPLRFIELRRKSPELYKQVINLESHLEERRKQVNI